MSSTVWAVPAANIWRREADIFRFLKDARCSVRIVEVRLFRTGRLSDRAPEDRRRGSRVPTCKRPLKRSRSTSPTVGPLKRRSYLVTNFNPLAAGLDRKVGKVINPYRQT
jgi:hypothetical protein